MKPWPDDKVPGFQSEVASFFKLCGDLSLKILNIMALGLQLEVTSTVLYINNLAISSPCVLLFVLYQEKMNIFINEVDDLSWWALKFFSFFFGRILKFSPKPTRIWRAQRMQQHYGYCTTPALKRKVILDQDKSVVGNILIMDQLRCYFRMKCLD